MDDLGQLRADWNDPPASQGLWSTSPLEPPPAEQQQRQTSPPGDEPTQPFTPTPLPRATLVVGDSEAELWTHQEDLPVHSSMLDITASQPAAPAHIPAATAAPHSDAASEDERDQLEGQEEDERDGGEEEGEENKNPVVDNDISHEERIERLRALSSLRGPHYNALDDSILDFMQSYTPSSFSALDGALSLL